LDGVAVTQKGLVIHRQQDGLDPTEEQDLEHGNVDTPGSGLPDAEAGTV
jgi:hypothetical protein